MNKIIIYRLFEKNNDYIELFGTNQFFIKVKHETYNEEYFVGKEIEDLDNIPINQQEFKKWEKEKNLQIIQNNYFNYKYINLFKKDIQIIRLNYSDIIPQIQHLDKLPYLNDIIMENIVNNLMKNHEKSKKNDKQLLNELLGENSYIENNKLKFLFKVKEIEIDNSMV